MMVMSHQQTNVNFRLCRIPALTSSSTKRHSVILLPHQNRFHTPRRQYYANRAHAYSISSMITSRLTERCMVSTAIRPGNASDCQSTVFLSRFEDKRRPSLQSGRKLPDSQYSVIHVQSDSESQADDIYNESDLYPSDESDSDSDNDIDDPGSWRDSKSNTNGAAAHLSRKPFDKVDFAREYDISALRVSAAEARNIAYRLHGHLLNWPRINNVARVIGDDLDDDIKDLIGSGNEQKETNIDSLRNAVYGIEKPSGGLSKRIQLVEKFGSQGYRHFPTLEQISRPKLKALKKKRRDRDNRGDNAAKHLKDKAYMVEVEEERLSSNSDKENEPILLKMGVGIKKWAGRTRLLLLDSNYAGKSASELPMAVQVLLNEKVAHNKGRSKREIVLCKLTLYYEYWSMDEILEELLPGVLLPSVYKNVGQIAHLNLPKALLPFKSAIAKVIYDKQRPKIQTVVNKRNSAQRPFCTLQHEVLAGNHSLVTTIIEYGIPFHVNLATMYWDSTYAAERQRLVESFNEKDVVCDVFAGVGPLAVAAAKKVWRVFANDLNPNALKYLAKNVSENKLQGKVEVYNLDGCEFIQKLLAFAKPVLMTRVVMDLPTDAEVFLDAFKGAFNRCTWSVTQPMPTIHIYGFSKASDPEGDFHERIICRLGHAPGDIVMHRVHMVAPGNWMLCATFQLPETVAFNDCDLL